MHRFILIVSALLLIITSQQAIGQTLTITGTCPGPMDFTVTGATPFGRIAFMYAWGTGSVAIPGGYPCAGTITGLNGTITLAGYADADFAGSVTITRTVPPAACGNIYVQAIDLDPCSLTAVVLIP